jgi:hypothetical protein
MKVVKEHKIFEKENSVVVKTGAIRELRNKHFFKKIFIGGFGARDLEFHRRKSMNRNKMIWKARLC